VPELRKDPITGRWVIISTERGKRPINFTKKHTPLEEGAFCPFCYGNEGVTPLEVLAYRDSNNPPNTADWKLRVVPNKFPALQIEGGLDRSGDGMYDKMNGLGAHEVIIESPSHDLTLGDLTEYQIEDVFWSFRDRIKDLRKDDRFKYVLVFKNHGEAAGASLEHSHSQLIALPIIPKLVKEEIDGSKLHYDLKERCIYCDIIKQEREQEKRLICENDHFVVVAPYAPRFPFETWILPKKHSSVFEESKKATFEALSKITKDILCRMGKALDDPSYNLTLHNSPFTIDCKDYYHWHIELMPKLTHVAGFEWGTGFYINPTPPEDAAKLLRDTVW